MELIALGATWMLLLLIVVAIVLLIFRRWKMALGLLLLAVAVNWWFKVMPVNFVSGFSGFQVSRGSKFHVSGGELKVMTFNCNLSSKSSNVLENRAGVIQFIREQDADVVFLTENFIMRVDLLRQCSAQANSSPARHIQKK